MTVRVAPQGHDCMVFAADGATSLTGVDRHGNQFVLTIRDHATRVINRHRRLPIAAMTAGTGSFGASAIFMISKDLRAHLRNGDACLDPDRRAATTPATEGAWWPARAGRLDARSGKAVTPPPPGAPGRGHPTPGPAPGTHVLAARAIP